MEDRQSIIGFTEAELGFFLALLMLALLVGAGVAKGSGEDEVGRLLAKNRNLEDRVVALTEANRVSARRIARLTDSIAVLTRPGMPSCVEKGVAKGSLATLVAVSAGEYALDGVTMTASQVFGRFAPELALGKEERCRQVVRLRPADGLMAHTFIAATSGLSRQFYVGTVR